MSAVNVVIYHESGGPPLGFRNPLNAWDYARSAVQLIDVKVLAECATGAFIVSRATTFDDFNSWYNNG